MAPIHHLNVKTLPLTGAKASEPLDLSRTGMPALDAIHDDKSVVKPKGGGKYRILRTTEVDKYEDNQAADAIRKATLGIKAPTLSTVRSADKTPVRKGKSKAAPSDNYAGTDRKAAKLSISTAAVEDIADVATLAQQLIPLVPKMIAMKIPINATSNRVPQEERNIHIAKAFLYASSREADNDFHLIVGCDPNAEDEVYMTMEVSGLPPEDDDSFNALNAARNAFKSFFGAAKLPGAGYHYYNPPIPVDIQGSLFFDATHSKGQAPGPPSLKPNMPTIFELHPVSSIKLG
jgi:hypothetical protein